MVANWSHLFPQGFEEPTRRGVMKAIKGGTGAIPNLCGHKKFFRRRDADQEKVLRVP